MTGGERNRWGTHYLQREHGSPKIPKRCGIATSYCLEVVLFIDWRIVCNITLYVSGFSPGNVDPHLVAPVKCGLALLVTDTVFIDGITLANRVLHMMGIFVGRELCSDELFSAP